MFGIFKFAAPPSFLLTGLVTGGAVGAVYRSVRGAFKPSGSTVSITARGGRLPLPPSVVNLTVVDEPALAPVNAFVDWLAELPLAQWLEVGRLLIDNTQARSTSWAIMDATIEDRRLGVAAWHVRDAIETVAFLVSHSGPPLSRKDRRLFATAHAAAEDAALAVLTRQYLSNEDCSILCSPFEPFAARYPFAVSRSAMDRA